MHTPLAQLLHAKIGHVEILLRIFKDEYVDINTHRLSYNKYAIWHTLVIVRETQLSAIVFRAQLVPLMRTSRTLIPLGPVSVALPGS